MSPSPSTLFPQTTCSICITISDRDYGFQKNGWEQDSTYITGNYSSLTLIKDFKPYSDRKLQLLQCPECHTYYLYRTDYEFLVGGSEDEQFLDRLTDEQAAQYLDDKPE